MADRRDSPELEVDFWDFNVSLDPFHDGPPALITSDLILSQACRITVSLRSARTGTEDDSDAEDDTDRVPHRKVWVTIGLTQVRRSSIDKHLLIMTLFFLQDVQIP